MRSVKDDPWLRQLRLLRDRVPSFESYPFNLPAVRGLDTLPFHPKVTFLVGENGSGKSTLLEAIAVQCDLNPEGGSRNFNFTTHESHSDLYKCLQLTKNPLLPGDSFFLRAESFYNVASEIDRMDKIRSKTPQLIEAYGYRSLHEQSHGESFFALFTARFRGHGLYFLDEPEAALSPTRQMSFLSALHDLCSRGSQFVIATHSPIIMAYPDAWIYVLNADGPRITPYEETEHYKVTRSFLTRTEKMLGILLADDSSQ